MKSRPPWGSQRDPFENNVLTWTRRHTGVGVLHAPLVEAAPGGRIDARKAHGDGHADLLGVFMLD